MRASIIVLIDATQLQQFRLHAVRVSKTLTIDLSFTSTLEKKNISEAIIEKLLVDGSNYQELSISEQLKPQYNLSQKGSCFMFLSRGLSSECKCPCYGTPQSIYINDDIRRQITILLRHLWQVLSTRPSPASANGDPLGLN